MHRSYSSSAIRTAVEPYPTIMVPGFDFDKWVTNTRNILYEEDGSVGLATFEYPGVYNVHWFFKVRGGEAVKLARRMLSDLYENHGAKTVRGITRADLRHVTLLVRRVGLKSHGVLRFEDGIDYEMFFLTEEDYNKEKVKWVR